MARKEKENREGMRTQKEKVRTRTQLEKETPAVGREQSMQNNTHLLSNWQ